jgi:RNA polymerase sigma-70 factor, ECF subfamily
MPENLPTETDLPADTIGELVAEHHGAVYRYAFRLCGQQCDAEDLTQQTYLAAFQNLHQLRERQHGRAWLFAILRNCFLRSRRKRVPLPATGLEIDVENIAADLPDEWIVDPERLQAALDDLPDEFKLVVLLFYFEGCSYREIAEKLSLPTGTVMSRLSRAKGRLRGALFDPDVEAPRAIASHPVG